MNKKLTKNDKQQTTSKRTRIKVPRERVTPTVVDAPFGYVRDRPARRRLDLSARTISFLDNFLENPKDGAVKAAIKAGFPKRAASEQVAKLLKDPRVIIMLDRRRQLIDKKVDSSVTRIIKELTYIAFSDMLNYYDDKGKMLPFKDMTPEARRAILTVEPTEYGNKLKLNPKIAALELLGKYRKIFDVRTPLADGIADSLSIDLVRRIVEKAPLRITSNVRVEDAQVVSEPKAPPGGSGAKGLNPPDAKPSNAGPLPKQLNISQLDAFRE